MTVKLFLATIAILFPLLTYAADVDITNNTDQPGVAKIGSQCSSIIGDAGIVNPGETKKIPQIVFDLYCRGPNPCKAELYMGKTCSQDNQVVELTIDRALGILSGTVIKPGFFIDVSPESLTISGTK